MSLKRRDDSAREDNRYLRRILRHWQEFTRALGSDSAVIDRLEISAETTLPLLTVDEPNAEYLFNVLRKSMASSRHLSKHAQTTALATFDPKSAELRTIVRNHIVGVGNPEYWGGLIAAEVFAEQFSDDVDLRAEVVATFSREPRGFAATAALAELVLHNPDEKLENLLREKADGVHYDAATHFKLVAALSKPDNIIEALCWLLARLPLDLHQLQLSRWIPALLRRIEKDTAVQAALRLALINSSLTSEKATFMSLLLRAGTIDEGLSAHMATQVNLARTSAMPEVGFDLVAQSYRIVEHVFVEALS